MPVDGEHGCILPLCYWGRPNAIEPGDWPGTDIHDRVEARLTMSDVVTGPDPDFLPVTLVGYSAAVGIQQYVGPGLAARPVRGVFRLDWHWDANR